jgi:hypothetical protein
MLFMTHPLLHYIIPVAILLLFRMDKKLVFLLSPLSVLPDIDFFFLPHRAWCHSVFFGALVVLISWLALRRYFKAKDIILIATIMFLSHDVLDGHVAWLYPLSSLMVGIDYGFDRFKWVSLDISERQPHISDMGYIMLNIIMILVSMLALLLYVRYSEKNKTIHKGAKKQKKVVTQ